MKMKKTSKLFLSASLVLSLATICGIAVCKAKAPYRKWPLGMIDFPKYWWLD